MRILNVNEGSGIAIVDVELDLSDDGKHQFVFVTQEVPELVKAIEALERVLADLVAARIASWTTPSSGGKG